MSLERKPPQVPGMPGDRPRFWGDAPEPLLYEEDRPAARGDERSGTGALMEEVIERDNLRRALQRVRANKGSPGVDGMTADQLADHLRGHWPRLREDLLAGRYQPQPVRRVAIPKASGGTRELGIPTVLDRFIQQAILQVLQPRFDPTFSQHSYGFRPRRSAHDAIMAAQRFIAQGRTTVVDVDLEAFFDRVNHDVLMGRLARRIEDKRLLKLLRAFLTAGMMADGVAVRREAGTPQGGPLSPLLANVLLDEVDKELERRGHAFVRYADDLNVYVQSPRAGARVMDSLREHFAALRLRVNESKSAVAPVWERDFLGYRFYRHRGEVRRGISGKAVKAFADRVRRLSRRAASRSLTETIARLNVYLRGWRSYFDRTQQVKLFGELDGWIRRRLRALQLRQWVRASTAFRRLRALGASFGVAVQVAHSWGRWWRHALLVGSALSPAWFDGLGLVRLAT